KWRRWDCASIACTTASTGSSGGLTSSRLRPRPGSGGREMGPQLLTPGFGRIGVDQDEREHGRRRTVVDPGVHRAALHDDVAGLHVHDFAAVEFEAALARKQ